MTLKCKKCGKFRNDRGMMYSQICSPCCLKFDLCEDCGNPIDSGWDNPNFACTGWHHPKGVKAIGTFIVMQGTS